MWRTLLVLLVCLLVGGCKAEEHAVLITAHSELRVYSLEVTVAHLSDDRSHAAKRSGIRRFPANSDTTTSPIRVAIELDSASYVMVHLAATTFDGQKLVATRCYDVRGVITDDVLLAGPFDEAVDADQDGFPINPASTCLDPGPTGPVPCEDYLCTEDRAEDCDDNDPSRNPGARELCADRVDQDCDGEDAPCEDADGDGYPICSATPMPCDCDDEVASIHPNAADTCGDGLDQDCDGSDDFCDLDEDGSVADFPVGGFPDCDDTDPNINPNASEVCTVEGTPRDEDCDGLVDELEACTPDDLDRDGFIACAGPDETGCDCNDCDPGVNPSARERCGNSIDEDCSMGPAPCPNADKDGDGEAATSAGGSDCNDSDRQIYPGSFTRCTTGTAETCGGSTACDNDFDGDGYIEPEGCERNVNITPWSTDVCNGIDDNCDATTDEVIAQEATITFGGSMRTLPAGTWGCVVSAAECGSGTSCVIDFSSSVKNCGGCRNSCNPGEINVADVCVSSQCDCSSEPGVSACVPGSTCCPMGGCRNLSSSLTDCGRCGNQCNESPAYPIADTCMDGSCRCGSGPACSEDQICCGGACVDTCSAENCGACGNTCGARMTCSDCMQCACTAPYLNCDGSPSNGCEVDPRSNALHCGECNQPCILPNATATCSSGQCRIQSCNEGWGDCDSVDSNGCERSLRTVLDCNGCGVRCGYTNGIASCSTGTCNFDGCTSGYGNCDDDLSDGCETRVNTLADCGGCGVPCDPENAIASCSTGTCTITGCEGDRADCNSDSGDGCEVDTDTDVDHCGACFDDCDLDHADTICVDGDCEIEQCHPGYRDCRPTIDGCETNINTSEQHCGGCFNNCGGICIGGFCRQ